MAGSQLQIIGAGMGRTGTDSLRNALIQLGFDPCHHMFVLREDARHVPPWLAVARGEAAPDWDGLL
ncbi:MAG: sulfotransferase, partial [Pseudomonadota bacterium]